MKASSLRIARVSDLGEPASRPRSPCIGTCQIEPDSGWCLGCRRTLDEIARWASADADELQRVLEQLPHRRWPQGASP